MDTVKVRWSFPLLNRVSFSACCLYDCSVNFVRYPIILTQSSCVSNDYQRFQHVRCGGYLAVCLFAHKPQQPKSLALSHVQVPYPSYRACYRLPIVVNVFLPFPLCLCVGHHSVLSVLIGQVKPAHQFNPFKLHQRILYLHGLHTIGYSPLPVVAYPESHCPPIRAACCK